MFQRTTAVNKLLAMKARKKIVQGGTWAGKTYGIMAVVIDYLIKHPKKHLTVVTETIPAIKKGALANFFEIMMNTGRWMQSNYNATERIYKFSNGSIIEFNSFDSVGKAQAAGKRTDLFINEAPYITYEIADALIMRTSDNVWIDFNPTHEFWAHTELLGNPDAEFLLLKYTDNEALPHTIYQELMMKLEKAKTSSYWANWCRVYIDGEIGSLEGVVFNWKIIDMLPKEARLIAGGIDFGYTNDPTAGVLLYKYNDGYIVDEALYRTGMVNQEIYNHLKAYPVHWIADSAEPKSIQELINCGLRVQPATKGADSVSHGIQLLQAENISVTSQSVNIIREMRYYSWDKDRQGNRTGKPIDQYNHAMDAIRYIALNNFNKNLGVYRIR